MGRDGSLALQAASTLAEEGVEVEVIDVGTLMPFDAQPCVDSVLRTGRLVVLHEAQWSGGLGHTIQSRIMESAFYALEAAPVVIGALDTPVPFSPPREPHHSGRGTCRGRPACGLAGLG